SKIDYSYLSHFLNSAEGQKRVLKLSKGTTRLRTNLTDLKKVEIPLPSLDKQIRIRHLLSKVEELIVERKQHLQELEDLLKSVFLEMFGDPMQNKKGWDKSELKQFGSISTGNTPSRKDASNYSTNDIEWIKTDNITVDSVYVTHASEYLSEIGAKKGRTVTNGALLVACIAGSVESIGRAALTNRTVAFNQQINAIQPNADVNPFYLYGLFKISKAYIQRHATKGMKKILTKGEFEKIRMIKPPVDLQNQFGAIVEKLAGIKARYQQSLADLENLYGALSQKAFRGELDLSRIVLPAEDTEARAKPTPVVPILAKTEPKPPIELPAPADLNSLTSVEGRNAVIGQWLQSYFAQLGDTVFSAEDFMEAAQQRLWELVEDEAPQLGAAVYDQLKDWVFQAVGSGRLTQTYDDAENRIQLVAAKS